MEDNEVINVKKRNMLFPFIITQCVCIAVILLTVFAVKLFFKDTYKKAKYWYEKNICVDTDIASVIEDTQEKGAEK